MSFISELKSKIELESKCSKHDYVGFQDVEIETVMNAQGVSLLPATYQQFLNAMGHQQAGGLFRGADVSFGSLKVMKHQVELSIDSHVLKTLPLSNVFFFLSYQSADYFMFYVDPADDDPPVYYLSESQSQPIKVADRLSQWFLEQAFNPIFHAMKHVPDYKPDPNMPF